MKKYVVFCNLRIFSTGKLLKYLRKRIRVNVRMKISVGRYGQCFWVGRGVSRQSKIKTILSAIFKSFRLYENSQPYVLLGCKK